MPAEAQPAVSWYCKTKDKCPQGTCAHTAGSWMVSASRCPGGGQPMPGWCPVSDKEQMDGVMRSPLFSLNSQGHLRVGLNLRPGGTPWAFKETFATLVLCGHRSVHPRGTEVLTGFLESSSSRMLRFSRGMIPRGSLSCTRVERRTSGAGLRTRPWYGPRWPRTPALPPSPSSARLRLSEETALWLRGHTEFCHPRPPRGARWGQGCPEGSCGKSQGALGRNP